MSVLRSSALLCLCVFAALSSFAAGEVNAPVPAALFASRPRTYMPRLSPDGKHMTVTQRQLVNDRDIPIMFVYRLSDMQPIAQVRLPAETEPVNYRWVSNTRIVVATGIVQGSLEAPRRTGELLAMDLDGSDQQYLFGLGMLKYGRRTETTDWSIGYITGVSEERDGRVFVTAHPRETNAVRTMLYSINSKGGARKVMADVPLPRANFLVQRDGIARYAYAYDKNAELQILKLADPTKEWVPVSVDPRIRLDPIGFNTDNSAFYALLHEDGGPGALLRESVDTGKRDPLAKHSVGDIDVIEWSPKRTYPFAATTHVGVPTPRYIDPSSSEAQLHKELSALFPGSYVSFQTYSDDGQKLIFEVSSDREPGTFYLFDRQTKKAERIFSSMPWIDPKRMGVRKPIEFTSRDGLQIHGYLTLPPGGADKNLPLVLHPHGGPLARDTWFFDRDAQFLATRGYAVLQVNFRGSTGRGTAFENRGWRHWGDHMPDDMIDGVRWAIAQGIADPARICAYGASYGAYASMMVSIRAPELFKCAVGYAGLYDLAGWSKRDEMMASFNGRAYLARAIGEDPAELARFSPSRQTDKLKVPVLLVHGEEDQRTPVDQFKSMRDALKDAGRPAELMLVPGEGHGFHSEKNRIEFYQKLEAFLARHIGK